MAIKREAVNTPYLIARLMHVNDGNSRSSGRALIGIEGRKDKHNTLTLISPTPQNTSHIPKTRRATHLANSRHKHRNKRRSPPARINTLTTPQISSKLPHRPLPRPLACPSPLQSQHLMSNLIALIQGGGRASISGRLNRSEPCH